MAETPTYTESIRKLTTAAEEDDAVTTGQILSELGPEKWSSAVKDMIALNRKDIRDDWDNRTFLDIPLLCVDLDKSGNSETLTVYQQSKYQMNEPLAVAKVTEDVSGKNLAPTIDKDVVRQLTTAAENGDAVTTARILNAIGTDKWASTTKDMLALNREDIWATKGVKWIPNLRVGYERQGGAQTLKIWQQPDSFPPIPLAKVTDRK